jgi:Zn-dependent M28 family amino/carboxypeptidase
LHGRSLGARDNGSGIAALLAAAESAAGRTGATADKVTPVADGDGRGTTLGFLVTGAEEFGLVGARILSQRHPDWFQGREVVNIDTVDQEGVLTVVVHDERGRHLGARLLPVLPDVGHPPRLRRLPLGIFVDSVPLARAGAAAVTIGRLTWRTLRYLHTAADVPDGLSFEAALAVGRRLGAN